MFLSLFCDLNGLFGEDLLGLNRLFRQQLFCLSHFLQQSKKKTKHTQIVKTNEIHNPTFKDKKFHRLTTIEYLRPVPYLLLHLLKRITIHVLHGLSVARHSFAKGVSMRDKEVGAQCLLYINMTETEILLRKKEIGLSASISEFMRR